MLLNVLFAVVVVTATTILTIPYFLENRPNVQLSESVDADDEKDPPSK